MKCAAALEVFFDSNAARLHGVCRSIRMAHIPSIPKFSEFYCEGKFALFAFYNSRFYLVPNNRANCFKDAVTLQSIGSLKAKQLGHRSGLLDCGCAQSGLSVK